MTKAIPKAKPEADANPNLLSVVEKSTTHLPHHFSSQVSAYNLDPSFGYNGFYGNSLNSLNQLPHLPATWPGYYNNAPYLSHPSAYRRNYLGNDLGSVTPNLSPYSLSLDGDGSWYFLDGTSYDSSGLRGLAFNNALRLRGLHGLTYPLAVSPLAGGLYPGLLNANLNAHERSGLYPGWINGNLNALDRLNLNARLLGRPSLYDASSVVAAAAVHNSHSLGKSKEGDYKMKDD